jgi:hypothetical protein
MFEYADKYDLSICAPSLHKTSQLTWDCPKTGRKINQHIEKVILHYVNFIEVGLPLFNKCSLLKLMDYHDSSLIAYGIDLLYMFLNDYKSTNKFAIIDKVISYHPFTHEKNNGREHDKINKNEDIIFEEYIKILSNIMGRDIYEEIYEPINFREITTIIYDKDK